jgi:hypothetical protein
MPCSTIQMEMLNALLPLELSQAVIDHGKGTEDNQDETFRALSFILFNERRLLEHAIDILDDDQSMIVCFQSTTYNRFLWQVSSRKSSYICLGKYVQYSIIFSA